LANIGLLGVGLEHHIPIQLLDPHNRIRLFEHGVTLSWANQFGTYVSLVPFAGSVTGVTMQGMKYTLTDEEMDAFQSLGISNEIVEDEATITWNDGYLLVIESKD
jgi:thiamine pyrophosphokinase